MNGMSYLGLKVNSLVVSQVKSRMFTVVTRCLSIRAAWEIAAFATEKTRVKRIVDIGAMHHFDGVWDGFPFWSQLFEYVPVEPGTDRSGG